MTPKFVCRTNPNDRGLFLLAQKKAVKRTKTKYTGIYFNESTKRYDVKYNYTALDVQTGKNVYKSKWVYGVQLLKEAQAILADMQTNGITKKETELTFGGALELWKREAVADNLSPITIRNTEQHFAVLAKFLPPMVKMKDITIDMYKDTLNKCRAKGYSEESLHSYNATFRKLVNIAYSKGHINNNILTGQKNFRTDSKKEYRLITADEYRILDQYFAAGGFVRNGVDNFKEYRLLFAILYFTGLRIGEALALTYEDFEKFDYYAKGTGPSIWVAVSPQDTKAPHLRGKRIKIKKSYATKSKQTKGTKNRKERTVPINDQIDYLLGHINKAAEYQSDPKKRRERLFPWTDGAVNATLARACENLGLEHITCHAFRHTYISNLIRSGVPLPVIEKVSGDTQATILRRYSHMFEQDERLVLEALQNT